MPDTKITALTAIGANPIIPATFPIPMVDLTDTSMAASGTTKKVTVNQILGAGGTATLASATITGDLTVRTTGLVVNTTGVGIGISPTRNLSLFSGSSPVLQLCDSTSGTTLNDGLLITQAGVNTFIENAEIGAMNFRTSSVTRYSIDATGISTWSVAGSTAMTLNSTGLALGLTTQYARLTISATGSTSNANIQNSGFSSVVGSLSCYIGHDSTANRPFIQSSTGNAGTTFDLLIQPYGGNVGIGVTPSASWVTYKALEFDTGIVSGSSSMALNRNCYFDGVNWRYKATTSFGISQYQLSGNGSHIWNIASSGSAGAAINGGTGAWTQAMTLDASANLTVGTTVISPTINGPGAITAKGLAGITMQTVTALATNYTLPIGAFAGLIVIRSNGGGGSAVFMLDPNAGAVSISNNIVGRTITLTYSGGAWQFQQTVGAVPSTYNYLVLATQ